MSTEKENYQDNNSQDYSREANNRENYNNRGGNYRKNDNNYGNDRGGDAYRSNQRPYNNNNRRPSYNNEDRPYNNNNYNRRNNNYSGGGYNNNDGERRSYNRNNNNSGGSYNRSYNNNNNNYSRNNDNRRYNSNPNWRNNNTGESGGYYNNEQSRSNYSRVDNKPRRPRINRPSDGEEGGRPYNNNNYGNSNYRSNNNNYRSNNNNYRGNSNNYRGNNNNYRNNNNSGGYNRSYNNNNNNYNNRGGGYGEYAQYSQKKQIEYKEILSDPNEPLRLNKYLANAGVCSRREADEFIAAGAVAVNDQIVTELGTKVKRSDEVRFNGDVVTIERKQYVLLNKPKDFVTTMDDPEERRTVMDLVKEACEERIYPVGRLDKKTTGVLLLTNDGELASKLTHPKYNKKKIYQVTTDKNVAKGDLDQILAGIELTDGEIKADAAGYIDPRKHNLIGIEIHSGKNRIVRRIFESLGYKVIKLDRVFFAGLTKKGLRRGDWRYLTQQEVNFLQMGSFE